MIGPKNVVLVVVDGLRPDHLGAFGYARATSPWLDEALKSAAVAEQAVCHANWTLPSFCSLLASRYPTAHGVFRPDDRLGRRDETLAETLRGRGFRTAAFVGGTFLDPQFGLDRGFEVYRAGKNVSFKDFKDTLPLALDWMRRRRGERFFAMVHHNDLHPPFDLSETLPETVEHRFGTRSSALDAMTPDYYFVRVFNGYPWEPVWGPAPPAEYRKAVEAIRADPRELEHLVAHYDAQILAADAQLKSLWAGLGDAGLLEETLVVLTSDHGMEWGERGLIGSCFHECLWDSVVRVPLAFWCPGGVPRRLRGIVEHVDVAPTVLGLLGMPPQATHQGRDLSGALRQSRRELEPAEAFSAASALAPMDRMRLFALRSSEWKVIFDEGASRWQLFDLAADPGETSDVASRRPDILEPMRRRLLERLGKTSAVGA